MLNKKWQEFEYYICNRLSALDYYCRPTKGSGNQGEKGDIKNSLGLHIEAKQRNTKSVTINNEVWEKTCQEIPFHSDRIPILALENKYKKRWAVLDLDDFLDIFIELSKYRKGEIE